MKKIMAFLLAILLTLSFAACQPQGEEINLGLQTPTPTQEPIFTGTGDIEQPTETPVSTQEPTQDATQETDPAVTPDGTSSIDSSATQGVTQEATPEGMQATQKPSATPAKTPTKEPTKAPTKTPTKAPTATTKPSTAKPTATSTANPGNPYSPVSKLIIANDPVAPAINLDSKVPSNLKTVYNTIKNGLSASNVTGAGEKAIALPIAVSQQTLRDAIYYVRNYNPQLFYVDWSEYGMSGTSENAIKTVKFTCTDVVKQVSKVENVVNQIVAEANKKANLFERELYVHDWLVKNISYTTETENCANIYGALVEGKALCEGYSRAFQYLMNKIGIETVLITGSAGEAHMWNMVKLDGQYYFVDVTHDDPTPDQTIKNGQEYLISHSCFNVTTSVLSKTHTITTKGSFDENSNLQNADLQTCTKTTYNYYYVKGLAVSNMEQFKYVLYENKSLQNVEVFFTETMPNEDALKEIVKEFFRETYSGKTYPFTYTSPSSASAKRNCTRISWTIK